MEEMDNIRGREPMENWKIRSNDWLKELWWATKEMNYPLQPVSLLLHTPRMNL